MTWNIFCVSGPCVGNHLWCVPDQQNEFWQNITNQGNNLSNGWQAGIPYSCCLWRIGQPLSKFQFCMDLCVVFICVFFFVVMATILWHMEHFSFALLFLTKFEKACECVCVSFLMFMRKSTRNFNYVSLIYHTVPFTLSTWNIQQFQSGDSGTILKPWNPCGYHYTRFSKTTPSI